MRICNENEYAEKAQQLRVLKENATAMGNYSLEDQYYLLCTIAEYFYTMIKQGIAACKPNYQQKYRA